MTKKLTKEEFLKKLEQAKNDLLKKIDVIDMETDQKINAIMKKGDEDKINKIKQELANS